MTKWVTTLSSALAAQSVAERAWDMAAGLRPGPVCIGVPLDIGGLSGAKLSSLSEAFPGAIWCSDIGEHLTMAGGAPPGAASPLGQLRAAGGARHSDPREGVADERIARRDHPSSGATLGAVAVIETALRPVWTCRTLKLTMSAGEDLIVLWAAKDGPDTCVWLTNAPQGVRVMLVAPDALAKAVRAALVRGPVMAVVERDLDAHRALAVGVDEVVRASEASGEALARAAKSARLRAMGREAHPSPSSVMDNDARAIELLAASVGHRLASPLAVASLNVEILRAAMGAMTGLADAYARETAARRDHLRDSEVMRVVALRASAPPSVELRATIDDLALALGEASTAVAQVYSLILPEELGDDTDLTTVVHEVGQLVGIVIERVADFRVIALPEPCRVTMPRSQLVHALSALLGNALQAVRDRGERGIITLRASRVEDVALVEIIDNGVGMTPHVRTRAIEPFFTTRESPAAGLGLSSAAERVRRHGGDLVLESEFGLGTTVRVFLPLVAPAPTGVRADSQNAN